MELNKGRKGISELFQLKLTSYRKVYSNNIDFQSFDYWGEIGAALETVLSIFESYEKDGIVPEREVWLESQSDKIHGVIDELIVNSSGVTIVEYKSTSNLDNLGQEGYVDQLHFYHRLVSSSYEAPIVEMKLVGLDGVTISVEFDRERQNRIMDVRREMLARFGLVDGATLNPAQHASVSCNECHTCRHKTFCDANIPPCHVTQHDEH